MVKAVLTHKPGSIYDDLPEQRYHFPATYLRQVEAARGDWIVYYEPRRSSAELSSRGGRQAYVATARVTAVEPDPVQNGLYYAQIEEYLPFDRAVPFREGERYYEAAIQRDDGATSKGAFGRAVRSITDAEYEAIFRAGFAQVLEEFEVPRPGLASGGFAEEPAVFERPILERLVARPFRDAAFANVVKAAYDNTCAATGLKIINGGGRAEVQAAHIRPVAASGTDSVRNGLALCGTAHWMFDRGLISIADDYSILVAKDRLPDDALRLLSPDRLLRLPADRSLQPHPQFLRYHRETVFKG